MAPRTSLACILTGPSRSAPDSDFIFLDGTLNQVIRPRLVFHTYARVEVPYHLHHMLWYNVKSGVYSMSYTQ